MEALWKELETLEITDDDMLVLPKGAMELLGSSESREMKMYVRPCYTDLYDLIYGKHKTEHIIVIGNPGIGKSYFLLYLMFRLRKKDKDMSLFFSSAITSLHLLFFNDEVKVFDESYVKTFKPMKNVTYLFDCGTRGQDALIKPALSHKTIISTSPDETHYKSFLKLSYDHGGAGAVMLYMPPWSLEELQHLSKYRFQVGDLHEKYRIVGGIPRYVFSKRIDVQKRAIDKAIMNSDLDDIVKIARMLPDHMPSKTSHSLLQLKLKNNDRTYEATDIMFASEYVLEKFCATYRESCVNHMRAILVRDREHNVFEGQIFEKFAHVEVASGKVFTVRSLDNNVESNLDLSPTPEIVWFKNVKDLAEHKITSAGTYPKNVYLRPKQQNFKSLDSIMLIGGTDRAIGFQMTIRKTHPIVKTGLQAIRQALFGDCERPFEIYFVVPKEMVEYYKGPQTYWGAQQRVLTSGIPRKIQQYVLPLDLELFKC